MEKYKILLVAIIIIIILILTITITLIKLIPTLTDETENLYYGDVLDVQEETNYLTYKILTKCIEKYLVYKDTPSICKFILEENRNEKDQIDENYYLKISKIYKIERADDTTYYIESLINEDYKYYLINVDYRTKAFNIRKMEQQEFNEAKSNKVEEQYKKSIEILLNNYNKIDDTIDNELLISNMYYNNYVKMAIEKTEIAFNMLDIEYKKNEFGNSIEKYKEYIQTNEQRISTAEVKEVNVTKNEEYTQYEIINTYQEIYIIKEYNYMDFTIAKEGKQEDLEEYKNSSEESKVIMNIEKIFKMLNQKEYDKVYECLNREFKYDNFSTLEKFKEYAQEEFFEYNFLGNIRMQEQGKNYIVTVPYKNSEGAGAEKKSKKFVMRIEENANFEISFEK